MNNRKQQVTHKQTDYSVCAQCKNRKLEEMPNVRYVLFLSVLPWIMALILSYFVHSIFLVCIPLIGFLNMKAAKRKPLRRCQSCHHIQPHQVIQS
ncbi:hypothetical protein [Halalkalibacter alkalisediminis]|uniref:LITAF domain-containing protein n=1 Tax=Halalkalibacter alkalisediminis TaxID=935616 RepID=A0ABV6NJV9_9BACI|nr:hypothetical protein [Halalkalibacter alkalisediminis]